MRLHGATSQKTVNFNYNCICLEKPRRASAVNAELTEPILSMRYEFRFLVLINNGSLPAEIQLSIREAICPYLGSEIETQNMPGPRPSHAHKYIIHSPPTIRRCKSNWSVSLNNMTINIISWNM
jgi:hypothetical protein